MPYADNQGIRIHYQIEGEGPPLVLQHGFTQSVRDWYLAGYVDALKPAYQLILIDARGHGGSEKPHDRAAYTWPIPVYDVLAVLDHLHLPCVHFWGYSMGGEIAYGLAKYAPERVGALLIGGSHPYASTWGTAFRDVDGTDPAAFLATFETRLGTSLQFRRFRLALQSVVFISKFLSKNVGIDGVIIPSYTTAEKNATRQ